MLIRLRKRLLAWIRARVTKPARSTSKFDAALYWENRYAAGGTSGEGSYGRLADFKSRVINDFVVQNDLRSVIEFGCGDGNQLSLLQVPRYTGLDVSKSALMRCIERFKHDDTKAFFVFDVNCFRDSEKKFVADAALSLDVIYHLVDDQVFEAYMAHLCASAGKFLILYTTDYDRPSNGHQRPREVSKWMHRRTEFVLTKRIPNPFPGNQDDQFVSDAQFLIYERRAREPSI